MLENSSYYSVVSLIGQRVRIGGDASVKRQRFRSYLVVFRAKIDAKAADDFVFSQELRDVDTLEAESLEVRHYIVRRLFGQFDAAIRDYKSARFDQWAGSDPKRQQERRIKPQSQSTTHLQFGHALSVCLVGGLTSNIVSLRSEQLHSFSNNRYGNGYCVIGSSVEWCSWC